MIRPQNGFSKDFMTTCKHQTLSSEPTSHRIEAGYRRPTLQQRTAAVTAQGHMKEVSNFDIIDPFSFPAPLILPGDDLSIDPQWPPQSLRAWIREKDRNKVTPEKQTIYIAAPPEIAPDVEFMRTWILPCVKAARAEVASPSIEDIASYVSAFYHGLPVKLLPLPTLRFTGWDEDPMTLSKVARKGQAKQKAPQHVGLTTSTETIRIRTRRSLSPAYPQQLNLDDILDVAISVLPDDAYALLLLVEHDLYEDEDDEFVCGRAYGGSRVAVVSTARYHPGLDDLQGVDREHAWPASHCEKYLQSCCAEAGSSQALPIRAKKAKARKQGTDVLGAEGEAAIPTASLNEVSPLRNAVAAHVSLPSHDSSITLAGLWLGRVCKTATHELGHCFGMDHCVYYACLMQGSASIAEDARQPPYLCPVDEAKLARATGTREEERRAKLLEFCNMQEHVETHLFKGFAAWIMAR